MTGYQPRRGPNMNQYIANLNSLPASEPAAASAEAGFGQLEDELSLFTNVEFLNEFDLGDSVEGSAEALGPNAQPDGDGSYDDGFNFAYIPPTTNPLPFGVPYPPGALPTSGAPFSRPPPTPTTAGEGATGPAQPSSAASPSDPASVALEASSRAAAEEDKRRRNTAASARFRVKKKQREQALERTAKEMTDRAEKLEQRISELEQENKFLRSLVVEKASSSDTGKESEVGETLRKVAADARKADSSKKGVGTTITSSKDEPVD